MKIINLDDYRDYSETHHICISTPVVNGHPQLTEYHWTYTPEEREEGFPKKTNTSENGFYEAPTACGGTIFPYFDAEFYMENTKNNQKDYRIVWEKKDVLDAIERLARLVSKMEE